MSQGAVRAGRSRAAGSRATSTSRGPSSEVRGGRAPSNSRKRRSGREAGGVPGSPGSGGTNGSASGGRASAGSHAASPNRAPRSSSSRRRGSPRCSPPCDAAPANARDDLSAGHEHEMELAAFPPPILVKASSQLLPRGAEDPGTSMADIAPPSALLRAGSPPHEPGVLVPPLSLSSLLPVAGVMGAMSLPTLDGAGGGGHAETGERDQSELPNECCADDYGSGALGPACSSSVVQQLHTPLQASTPNPPRTPRYSSRRASPRVQFVIPVDEENLSLSNVRPPPVHKLPGAKDVASSDIATPWNSQRLHAGGRGAAGSAAPGTADGDCSVDVVLASDSRGVSPSAMGDAAHGESSAGATRPPVCVPPLLLPPRTGGGSIGRSDALDAVPGDAQPLVSPGGGYRRRPGSFTVPKSTSVAQLATPIRITPRNTLGFPISSFPYHSGGPSLAGHDQPSNASAPLTPHPTSTSEARGGAADGATGVAGDAEPPKSFVHPFQSSGRTLSSSIEMMSSSMQSTASGTSSCFNWSGLVIPRRYSAQRGGHVCLTSQVPLTTTHLRSNSSVCGASDASTGRHSGVAYASSSSHRRLRLLLRSRDRASDAGEASTKNAGSESRDDACGAVAALPPEWRTPALPAPQLAPPHSAAKGQRAQPARGIYRSHSITQVGERKPMGNLSPHYMDCYRAGTSQTLSPSEPTTSRRLSVPSTDRAARAPSDRSTPSDARGERGRRGRARSLLDTRTDRGVSERELNGNILAVASTSATREDGSRPTTRMSAGPSAHDSKKRSASKKPIRCVEDVRVA